MAEKKRKTLLFLCNCGANIADFLDMEAVADWAVKRGDVAVVKIHYLLCSPDGKKFLNIWEEVL